MSDEEAGDIKNIPLINLLLLVLKIKSVFHFLFLPKKTVVFMIEINLKLTTLNILNLFYITYC